jgi:hypothetical protein
MSPTVRRVVFSLVCVVPALIIAFFIRDIGFLVILSRTHIALIQNWQLFD